MSNLEEFQKAKNNIVNQISSSSSVMVKKWSKPPKGHFQLDVDAGLNDQNGKYSVGAVIRDGLGNICVASAKSIHKSGSVMAAELVAIQDGLLLATHEDLFNVWVFSNSISVVQKINLLLQRFLTTNGPLFTAFYSWLDLIDF